MGNFATKMLLRIPYGLLLLLCLAFALAFCTEVVLLNWEYDSGTDAMLSFSFSYHSQVAGLEVLLSGDPAITGSLVILVLLCIVLPALRLAWGMVACLLAGTAMTALFASYSSAHLAGPHDLDLGRFLICLFVVFLAFLLVRGLLLFVRRLKVSRFLQQYIPSHLMQHYMKHPNELGLGGESRNMTIMFCDIKRFTAISERLDPELLPAWLNRYFDTVGDVIVKHGGTIDKYIGDSVMAFWGAPQKSDTHASDALNAARDILIALEKLSDQLVAEGRPPIAVGIGISTGNANVGHLGSKKRMTYTVVGDAVNTADRLQRCTSAYNLSLVVNDAATESVPDFLFRELDTVHVKGRQRFVRIFQPICHQDEAIPNTHRQLQLHRKAMQFYRRGMWEDAEKLFRLLSDETNEVAFYKKYIERMINIRNSEPEDGADYIVDFTQKIG